MAACVQWMFKFNFFQVIFNNGYVSGETPMSNLMKIILQIQPLEYKHEHFVPIPHPLKTDLHWQFGLSQDRIVLSSYFPKCRYNQRWYLIFKKVYLSWPNGQDYRKQFWFYNHLGLTTVFLQSTTKCLSLGLKPIY